MARRARSILLLAACAGALVACNLIAGLTEDYAVVGAKGDGSTPNDEASGDGSMNTDGSMQDSPVSEGGQDGGKDTSTTGPFCANLFAGDAANVSFCADFEEGGTQTGLNPFGWDSIFRAGTPDASFTIATPAMSGNGSAALDVVTDKAAAGTSSAAWLEHIIQNGDPNAGGSHYEAEMDFIDVSSPISYTALALITFDDGMAPIREHGFATTTGTTVSNLNPPGMSITDGHTWHHAIIRLDRPTVGGAYNRTLRLDAKELSISPAMTVTTMGGVKLRVGTFNTGTSGGDTAVLHARFDNIVVRQW